MEYVLYDSSLDSFSLFLFFLLIVLQFHGMPVLATTRNVNKLMDSLNGVRVTYSYYMTDSLELPFLT
jgi:hypothetical protein